jgi:CRP/FNR family transcriptional regulator, cyclic AMP receptor protein
MTSLTDSGTLGLFAVFAGVTAETLAELARTAQIQRWTAGQMLFQRGDAGDRLFAVTSGQVRLSLLTPSGRELVLKVVRRGDVLGEFAVIDGQSRSTDATAVDTVTALTITRERYMELAVTRPDLLMAMARYLCSMLRATNFQMESIALYDLQTRLIRFLLMSVRQTYGENPPEMAHIDIGMSQTDLAAVLGATRPRVNNALQELIVAGVIRRNGNILICSLPQLQDMAEVIEAGMTV